MMNLYNVYCEEMAKRSHCNDCEYNKNGFCGIQSMYIIETGLECSGFKCGTCTYHACDFGECKYHHDFVEFEIFLDGVQVCGFWDKRSPLSNESLEWMSWDGFECGHDFSKSNMVGETAKTEDELEYLLNWCLIEDFLSKVNVAQELDKNKDQEAIIKYGTDKDNICLKLYINCKHNWDDM